MTKKIRVSEEARINIDNGSAELHVAEESDNLFKITISEVVDEKLLIGIPNKHGIHYMFWKHIKKTMNDFEDGKLHYSQPTENRVEKEKENDNKRP